MTKDDGPNAIWEFGRHRLGGAAGRIYSGLLPGVRCRRFGDGSFLPHDGRRNAHARRFGRLGVHAATARSVAHGFTADFADGADTGAAAVATGGATRSDEVTKSRLATPVEEACLPKHRERFQRPCRDAERRRFEPRGRRGTSRSAIPIAETSPPGRRGRPMRRLVPKHRERISASPLQPSPQP